MNRLKLIRSKSKLSQAQMGEILGIGQTGVSQIETGKTSLSDRNRRTLMDKFSLPSDFFDDDYDNIMSFEIDKPTVINSKEPANKAQSSGMAKRLSKITDESGLTIETRPRIPYTVSAGTLGSIALEGETDDSCERIPVVKSFPRYNYTIIVKGDSMEPEYRAGDEVACLALGHSQFLQWGKVHVLDTTQGIIVKRIYDAGDCIKCCSINPDYPDFLIPKKEIYSLGLVVGLLRL